MKKKPSLIVYGRIADPKMLVLTPPSVYLAAPNHLTKPTCSNICGPGERDTMRSGRRGKYQKPTYPLLTAMGIEVIPENKISPAGCRPMLQLKAAGLYEKWMKWAGDGLTCGMNGVYPEDVERFLSGFPNVD